MSYFLQYMIFWPPEYTNVRCRQRLKTVDDQIAHGICLDGHKPFVSWCCKSCKSKTVAPITATIPIKSLITEFSPWLCVRYRRHINEGEVLGPNYFKQIFLKARYTGYPTHSDFRPSGSYGPHKHVISDVIKSLFLQDGTSC